MPASAQTPPPKSNRSKHQYSKSVNQPAAGASGKNNNGRHKSNRNAYKGNNMSPFPDSQANGSLDQVLSHNEQGYGINSIEVDGEYGSSRKFQAPAKHHKPQRSPNRAAAQSPPNGNVPQPIQDTSATPAKYAAAGFHASPAPSALPIPKFFSKSVPAGTASEPSLQSRLDAEQAESDSSSPGPSSPSVPRAPITQPHRHQESPLDIFFKADREEKAKKGNCLSQANGSPGPSTPPVEYSKSQTFTNEQPHHSRHSSQGSGKGIFPMELDSGVPTPRTSAKGSTPPISRSVTSPSQVPQSTRTADQESDSQALKSILFSLTQQKRNLSTPSTVERVPSEPSSRLHSPSPFNRPNSIRSTSGPSTPVPRNDNAVDSSLHYGNRNLSPLFKASKADSAKRSSRLRTEVTANSPTAPQGQFPPLDSTPINSRNANSDAAAASRNYLNTIITPSNQGFAPNVTSSWQDHTDPTAPGRILSPFHSGFAPASRNYSQPIGSNSSLASSHESVPINASYTDRSGDVDAMEASLRRLLNLNAVSGSTTGVR